ncbi:MAG TPA: histidine kinase dimerization/phospho-acceptor domain-containing protein [Ktedonobacteraceae bacterium]|jgi:nitrogen-specific signal transduction histidine kinase|nr:histidine kinase dimerization/phospho-acceptor domain-containing protein [Ktedonobacteraceae bacterium]
MNTREELEQQRSEHMRYVRHELKAPLANLKLAAQYLRRKLRKGDMQGMEEYITQMTTQVDTLTQLIDELLR